MDAFGCLRFVDADCMGWFIWIVGKRLGLRVAMWSSGRGDKGSEKRASLTTHCGSRLPTSSIPGDQRGPRVRIPRRVGVRLLPGVPYQY